MFACLTRICALKSFSLLILTTSYCLVTFLGVTDICAQTSTPRPEMAKLENGKVVERPLVGGQTESFQLELSANQYANIDVEQLGIDVVVRLADTDGKPIIEFDDDPRTTGTESAEIAVREAAVIILTVVPRQKAAPAGRFEIKLTELRGAAEADLALDDARRFMYRATALWRAGRYDEALPLAEKALEICGRELGQDSLEYGRALFVMANIYSDNGGLDKAVELYKKGIELKEKAVGKDDISMTPLLNNYAAVLKDKGDYPNAVALFQRVLEIRKKVLEPDHLLIASAFLNLASVYRLTGNVSKAAELYEQALKIRENALPPNHPDIATVLNNIANLYDDLERAEPLYKRALAIREMAFGPDSQEVGQTLYNFAVVYADAGDVAKADQTCRRALAIFEKKLGPEHYLTSYPLNLLGGIDRVTGKFDEAEDVYKRSIAIKEKAQGPYHPDLAGALTNLANLYAVKGETDKAVETQARANEIYEFNTALNLTVGSEREKLAYLTTLNFIQDQTLTLNIRTANRSLTAADLGMTSILRRKGRVLDAMSDSMRALRSRLSNEDQAIIDRLNDATTKLASLVVDGPPAGNLEAYRKQLDALVSEREGIENQISRLGAGYYATNKSVTLGAVRNVIPEDSALLEFAVYHPISPKSFEFGSTRSDDRERSGAARYVAYILHHTGETKWVDLGEASVIDGAIRDLRNAVRDPKRSDVEELARKLDEKIMKPLRSIISGSTHLLISSEGELNLMPFEALVGEDGKYLVEDYRITYLTSGRDLLRMGSGRENNGRPLIIANPAYGSSPSPQVAKAEAADRMVAKRTGRRSITATRSISDTYFAPLSGTAQEAQAIKKLFPDATILEGPQASKASLKKAAAPLLLHIATHGFFLTDNDLIPGSNRGVKPGSKEASPAAENPLVRSGLALAGANRRIPNNNDGILSSLEASGLDLWGTKLVVLSACDTGVGEVKTGEGVYGLRRSFIEAGAESLIMSLWPVSDTVTRELMINYYKNLKQGMGRGDALRQVQLEMLKRTERRHPFYWASFIQAGEWANLDGKR
jgi:CHAT domain-containing protein/Tfp pilus assembly protein PilF